MAPGRTKRPSVAADDSMYERSGLPSRKGVGTVITATSKPAQVLASVVGTNRPEASAAASSSDEMSSTYDSPAASRLMRCSSTS